MLEEGEMVSGEGWFSDDSSFYGDEDEQHRLLLLCEQFDPQTFWKTRYKDLNTIAAMERAAPPPGLHNPWEGSPDAWQLHESIPDFLERLPPRTTTQEAIGPWIWVANPYRDGQYKGKTRIRELTEEGSEWLRQYKKRKMEIQDEKAKSTFQIRKSLTEETELLKERLNKLAVEKNILSGKWMLFPAADDLHRVWRAIAEAVIDNRLGTGAKVATNNGRPGARLICVYTKDFRDTDDVLRILQEMVTMGLVKQGSGRGIYYKSDVYTHLDIYGNNAQEYGLQVSLYSSQKMLSSANKTPASRAPQQKQATLDAFQKQKS